MIFLYIYVVYILVYGVGSLLVDLRCVFIWYEDMVGFCSFCIVIYFVDCINIIFYIYCNKYVCVENNV